MASILLLTADTSHAAFTRTRTAFTGAGHTVTGTAAVAAAGLDAAWGAGFDLIATVRLDYSATPTAVAAWVSGKWASGVPIMESGGDAGALAGVTYSESAALWLGLVDSLRMNDNDNVYPGVNSATLQIAAAHQITAGYSGIVGIATGRNWNEVATPGDARGAVLGLLPAAGIDGPEEYMSAIEVGDPINAGAALAPAATAPARAVWCGWLYGGQADYTAAGRVILGRAATWLTEAVVPPTPTGSAALAITPDWTIDGTQQHVATAPLGVTSTWATSGHVQHDRAAALAVTSAWALDGIHAPPGEAAATLTVTSAWAVDGQVPKSAAATVAVTSAWSVSLTPEGGTSGATLAVTSSWTVDLTEGPDHAALTVGITSSWAVNGSSHSTTEAALGVQSGWSLWFSRTHTHDPATGRGTFRVVASHRDGTRYGELDRADVSSPIRKRLNAQGGTAFTMPASDPKGTHVRQFREVQVSRGGHHLDTFVLLRPQDDPTEGTVTWQAATLDWYFTRRRIGPAVRPNLLVNPDFEQGITGWTPGYREGSIPAKAPKAEITNDALTGTKALRVTGSDEVAVTVTRYGSDTTFARGSAILTSEGKSALREFVKGLDLTAEEGEEIAPIVMTVEGHTDSEPYTSHPGGNQWLSEQRASAVRSYLVTQLPEGATVNAVGYGSTRPVASNGTSAGMAQNRRVDIRYPHTVTAKGHRQFVQQSVLYTNPSEHITRNLTFVAWGNLEEYKEPNADGTVVWVGRRLPGTSDAEWIETASVDVDDETPLHTPTRWETSITVPADGQEWEIMVRLTPPSGTVVYDTTRLMADDALEFVNVDQALIVKGLVEHAQDPAYDKDDLFLSTATPLTGVKRTLVFYWHDRWTITAAIAEVTKLAGGVDVTIDTTPETRTVRTHYPQAGRVTDVALSTLGRVEDYGVSLDGESAATTTIVQADGSGADREEGVVTGSTVLDLVLEDVWTAEPGSHVGQLDEQAALAHRRYAGHVPLVTVTVDADHTDEMLDRINLGDVVALDVRSPLHAITGPHRISEWSLDPSSDRLTYAPTLEV